jgi:hypothetical protein
LLTFLTFQCLLPAGFPTAIVCYLVLHHREGCSTVLLKLFSTLVMAVARDCVIVQSPVVV